MPFPTPSADLMASAMGGPLMSSTPGANAQSGSPALASASASATSGNAKKDASSLSTSGTIRIFYSLKENPNAIISYADLIRQEQRRLRTVQTQQAQSSSKNGGSTASSSQSTTTPLKNHKVTGTGPNSKEGGATAQSSVTAMDIDPPEGEEALGEGDSEAEDDDEADEDDEDNEDDAEAEDEDDDEDPDEEDEDDDEDGSGRRAPKDFLEALTEKYAGLEEGNDGEDEDEDEDEDGKGQVYKRPSRWDTEHYDIEDEFIDDSEMMLESIGMVRPKVDGFFAFRGPVETTNEDPDSSDAGPRSRKPAKRKTAAGSSPLTGRSGSSKTSKGSNLAVAENANDSTSEMSEMDDKPKSTKHSSTSSGLVNSSTASAEPAGGPGGADGAANSVATTPTKKKTTTSKTKTAGKDIVKEIEAGKESDKESKAGVAKKVKAKSSKTTTDPSSAIATSTPLVRVDSPPPLDDVMDNSTPPFPPSRSASPSKSKSKSKASFIAEAESDGLEASPQSEIQETKSEQSPSEHTPAVTKPHKAPAATATETNEEESSSRDPNALEALNAEVQAAYDIVADLARNESWEVKSKFPAHIKAPLWQCARIALETRSSGYVLSDDFFSHLQKVFPYNKFTLKKLIYKEVLPEWISDLEQQKTRLMEQFAKRIKTVCKNAGIVDQEAPQSDKDGDGDVNMSGEEGKTQKKFPWTQDLRLLLWETMEKFLEILYAKIELKKIDDSQPAASSDSKTRKDAYQILLTLFPANAVTSYEISRQYSQLKEKVQKQEKKEVDLGTTVAPPIGKPRPVFTDNRGIRTGATAAARITGAPSSSASTARAGSATPTAATSAPATASAATALASATASAPTTAPAPTTAAAPVAVSATTPTSPPTIRVAASRSAPTAGSAASTQPIPTPVVTAATAAVPAWNAAVARDAARRASPSKSSSTAQRTSLPSATINTPSHQQRAQQHSFAGGSSLDGSVPESGKKRKNTEEAAIPAHGTGSSYDPVFIEEPAYDDVVPSRGYRHSGGSATEYGRPSSSSPLMSSSSQPVYRASEAAKKKKVAERRSPVSSTVMPSGHHSESPSATSYYQEYPQGARDAPMYAQRHPPSPPQRYAAHPSRGYPQSTQSQSHHYQHHERPPEQYYHRRGTSPSGPGGGITYTVPSHSSTSRGAQQPPPSGPQTGSGGPKTMSMNSMLHHSHSGHQHHSRQGPM